MAAAMRASGSASSALSALSGLTSPGLDLSAPAPSPTGGRAFCAPAQVRILLVPAPGAVLPDEFERWRRAVETFEVVKLVDLPPSKSGAKRMPSGSPLARLGEVHLSFVTSPLGSPPFLAPFSLSRQVLAVVGLGTSTADGRNRAALSRAPAALRAAYPAALAHRVLGFDIGAARPQTMDFSNLDLDGGDAGIARESSSGAATPISERTAQGKAFAGQDAAAGLVIFPAVRSDMKDVRFYLRTLLPELVSAILDGLDATVAALEGTPLETPRETLVPSLPLTNGAAAKEGSGSSSPLPHMQLQQSGGAASPSAAFTAHSFTPSSPAPSSATSRASAFFSSFSGPGTAGSSTASSSKKHARRVSVGTNGPLGLGRLTKVRADACLLAGDLWGALSNYESAMTTLGKERALAGGQDAVWYAGALEGWGVARVLVQRMGGLVEEKAPSLSVPGGSAKDKDKKAADKEPAIDLPYAHLPWGDVAEAYSTALVIYSKCLAPLSYLLEPARFVSAESPRDYTHPLLHAGCCLAYARFLLSIWASGGYNGEAFDQMIYGGIPPMLAETVRPSLATYTQHATATGVQRHEIAAAASAALTHSIAALKPPDQIAVLSAAASIFGCIGFSRREAYLLRQMQAAMVALLARSTTETADPVAPVPRYIEPNSEATRGAVQLAATVCDEAYTINTEAEPAHNIIALASAVCETGGINADVPPVKRLPRQHVLARALQLEGISNGDEDEDVDFDATLAARARARASWGAQPESFSGPSGGGEAVVERSLLQDEAPFGWAEQQIGLLRDTIGVCEVMDDFVGVTHYAALLLRDFHWLLSPDEQLRLARGLPRAVEAARHRGAKTLELQYWGPAEPVCRIAVVPVARERIPEQRPALQLREDASEAAAKPEGIAGLNNPFVMATGKPTTKEAHTLVVDEEAVFELTLQNTFTISLECSSIVLETTGSAFEALELRDVSIPPRAMHTLRLSGIPRDTGKVTVRGCRITLDGCAARSFRVSQVDASTDKGSIARATELDDRRVRIKAAGLEARPAFVAERRRAALLAGDAKPKRQSSNGVELLLECVVVPAQPLLAVEAATTSHGSLVLWDGEVTTLHLRLANIGRLPVDFLRLSFADNLADSARASLGEGELDAAEVHALETSLTRAPALAYARAPRDPLHRIAPGETTTLEVSLRGKLGCTNMTLQLEYAHVDGPGRGGLPTDETRDFYTRRHVVPLGVTVLPSVDCSGLEIRDAHPGEAVRLIAESMAQLERGGGALPDGKADAEVIGKASEAQDGEACLLCFDMRNLQRGAVDVAFDVAQDEGPALRVRRSLPGGGRARIVVPFARLHLSSAELSAPIPTLSARQFVVSRVKLSAREEQAARARFWLRQELLRRLGTGTDAAPRWTERASGRRGEVPLAAFTLNDEQGGLVRLGGVDVSLAVGGAAPAVNGDAVHALDQAQVEEYTDVVGTITNRSDRPLQLLYRLIPLPSTALSRAGQAMPSVSSAAANDAMLSHVLVTSGSLSAPVAPWPLPPGETARCETGLLFLSGGDYAFAAIVEEVPHDEQTPEEPAHAAHLRAAATGHLNVRVSCAA